MPRATGIGTRLSRYEDAWEAINRLIRRGGSWSGHERKCFYVQNERGEFENASAASGLDFPEDGRGLAVWDFDRDGDPDMVLKSRTAPQVRILRNDAPRDNQRLQLELEGTASNRKAIGARVTLWTEGRMRVKEVGAGSGFLSQGSPVLQFGLGKARIVERLEVWWPSGRSQSFRALEAGRRYRLREGDESPAAAVPFAPPSRPGREPAPALTAGAGPGTAPIAAPDAAGVWLIDPCPLPALGLRDPAGKPIDLKARPGRPLLLSFWSPQCPVCSRELEDWSRDGPGRSASGGPGSGPVLLAVASSAEADIAAAAAARMSLAAAVIDPESMAVLGVLLEEIGHWPREIPIPSSLLVDARGSIVKLYRGPVPWKAVEADAAAIPPPGTPTDALLRLALPFPGKYHATDLHRSDFQLGVSYLEAGLADQALLAFERAVARRPEQPDALYNLGVIHQRRAERLEARRRYQQAVNLEPDFADARVNLGVLLAEEGRLDEAAVEFARVLKLRPDHAEGLINLGNVELARGRPEEALRAYAAAQGLEPEIPQIQKKIGDAYRRAGDPESAMKAYELAARMAPKDPEVWSNLGVLQAESGDLEAALITCKKAIDVDPTHASAHNNAGLVLQALGKLDEAIASFRRAMQLRPELDAPYMNLARVLLRKGDEAEARKVLRDLLAVHPDHAQAAELLKRIKAR